MNPKKEKIFKLGLTYGGALFFLAFFAALLTKNTETKRKERNIGWILEAHIGRCTSYLAFNSK